MPFINKQDPSRELTIFMILFICSFEIINVVMPYSNIFLWIVLSVADAAAVNSNGIKTLLANGLSTFPIKDKPIFSNGPKSEPENFPNDIILCKCVFDNSILADYPISKAIQSFETWVLLNNNLWEKLFSSLESPTTFDENFRVISLPFFMPNFNLLSCDLDNSTFKVLYWVVLYWYYIKTE